MKRRVGWLICLPFLTGCITIQASEEVTWNVSNKPLPQVDWTKEKVLITAWSHSYVAARTTATAGGPGGMASASAETIAYTNKVPAYIVDTLNEQLPFDLVTPVERGIGKRPKYFLAGGIGGGTRFGMRWWTYLQLLDLWIHAWIFPTLGVDHPTGYSLRMTDAEGRVLKTWSVTQDRLYMQNAWGLLARNYDLEKSKLLRTFLERVASDLRASLPPGGQTVEGSR